MSQRAPDHATLWERINEVRLALPPHRPGAKRMSFDAFADHIGVDRGTIFRWKRRESQPDEDSREKLAAVDPEGHSPEWFSVPDRVVLAAALASVDGFGEAITQLRAEGFADDAALSQLEAAQDLARRLLIAQGA